MRDDPDHEVVQRALSGDYAAFESLVAKHQQRVYRLAMRIVRQREDAEEVVQQTFLSMLEHLDGFRQESGFATWLMRIATNHALALLRRRNSHRTVSLAESSQDEEGLPRPQFVAEWRQAPEDIVADRETRQVLTRILDELDVKYSLVFVLRDLEGFSTEETAEILHLSENNVKVRLSRARLMLRERLTRLFGEEGEPPERQQEPELIK